MFYSNIALILPNMMTYICSILRSLSPLFDNIKLDRELRSMVRETFPEFCTASDGLPTGGVIDLNNRDPYSMNEESHSNHNSLNTAKFSDDEEEQPVAKKAKKSKKEVKDVKEVNDTKNGKRTVKENNVPKEVKEIKENNVISASSALSKSDLIAQIEQMASSDMRSCLKKLYEDKYDSLIFNLF